MSEQDEIPNWWHKRPPNIRIESWRPAVTDYLKASFTEIQHEHFNDSFVKRILGFASRYDEQWKYFKKDHFDYEEYQAHRAFYGLVKDEYDKLINKFEDAEAERIRRANHEKKLKVEEQQAKE